MNDIDQHPAAIVFRQLVDQVDSRIDKNNPEWRAEFWIVFAARMMGMLAAQIGKEDFDEFMAGTTAQVKELFAAGPNCH